MAWWVLRSFLVTFGVVAGLSLLALPEPAHGPVVAYLGWYVPPLSMEDFSLTIVPGVAIVASVALAWWGRGSVRVWLAGYAGVVAGMLAWYVVWQRSGVGTAAYAWMWPYLVAGGAILFAGVPYLLFGLPTLALRRRALGRRGNGADSGVSADLSAGEQATAEGR